MGRRAFPRRPRRSHRDYNFLGNQLTILSGECRTEPMTDHTTGTQAGEQAAERYEPAAVEAKWQERWAADDLYAIDLNAQDRPRYYFLTMLPYPSGDLHIGHWFTMAPSDTRARYFRMRGYNVFFPIG